IAIYAFGTTSGAHLNPAVTVSLASVGRFPWRDVPAYVGAQLVGATLAAALIWAIYGGDAIDLGVGQTSIADGTNYLQAIVAEALGTFLLVTAIMALAVDRRAPGGWAGLMIGLAVAAAILLIGPLTGGSVNPSRTFGPLLIATIGGGDTFWGDLPAYIVGPLIGGVAAAAAYDYVARPRAVADELAPAQGTQGDIEGERDRAAPPTEQPAAARTRQGTAGEVTGRRAPWDERE
ncbi:MAG TPA: MIP/aquaporin family protein, partial [Conexibacter sp.]|nr:MIP/aquaporin family protein [Conexibacter sp.]